MPLIRRLTVLAFLGLCVGCGAHVPPAPTPLAAPPLPVEPVEAPKAHATEVPLSSNPTVELTARADREFATGQQELALGHLVAAREAFDRAVDVLLSAP